MDARVSRFPVTDAKARFSELVARVEAGDEIEITRHGASVARLVPAQESAAQAIARRRQAREKFEAWRDLHGPTLGPGITIKDLIEEGRS